MLKFVDYYVRPRDENDIETIAETWRSLAETIFGEDYFNIVDFIKKVVQKLNIDGKGRLKIAFLPIDAIGPPAMVTFNPLTLHVRVDVWEAARDRDEPWARYILAHECGHIIMHDHVAKGFSGDQAERIPASDQLRSSEWQADRFADYFLMPMRILERLDSAKDAAIRFGVDVDRASKRYVDATDYWLARGTNNLDQCDRCLDYNTRRIGFRVRCMSCGKMVCSELLELAVS